MVQKHQIAQYLLYMTSFVVNVHKQVHILTYLNPVILKKLQMAQFLLYLTSCVATMHKKYIF